MNAEPVTFLISMESPAGYIQGAMQQYACQTIGAFVHMKPVNRPGLPRDVNTLLDYNPSPFLQLLINEIFGDTRGVLDGKNLQSSRLLVQDGLPEDLALEVSNTAFKLTTDAVWQAIPDFPFGQLKNTTCDLVGDQCDLQITIYPSEES